MPLVGLDLSWGDPPRRVRDLAPAEGECPGQCLGRVSRLLLRPDDPQLHCPLNSLPPAPHAQFPVGPLEVVVHGVGGNEQAGGNLFVLKALGQEFENVDLAVG